MRSDPCLARNVIEHAVQFHVLVGRQLAVETRVLKDDAECAAGFDLFRDRIHAVEAHRPAGRPLQRREHLDGRRLARTVGSQERENLTRGDVERHAVNGFHLAECLDQVFDVNHVFFPAVTKSAAPAAASTIFHAAIPKISHSREGHGERGRADQTEDCVAHGIRGTPDSPVAW